ncbi:MAG: hypothetical protein ABIN25_07590 [Ginsengibacter sp.]
MKTFSRLIIFIILFIYSTISQGQKFIPSVQKFITDTASTKAFTDVKIIDGTGMPSKPHQDLVISQGKITSMGAHGKVSIPANANVINCTGKTIIPGMVMLHEHFYYTMMAGDFFNVAEMPFTFPRMYLAGGATTIRTGGSIEPQTDLNIKQMINEGKYIGPDIDVTAPYFERKAYDIPSLNLMPGDFWSAALTQPAPEELSPATAAGGKLNC